MRGRWSVGPVAHGELWYILYEFLWISGAVSRHFIFWSGQRTDLRQLPAHWRQLVDPVLLQRRHRIRQRRGGEQFRIQPLSSLNRLIMDGAAFYLLIKTYYHKYLAPPVLTGSRCYEVGKCVIIKYSKDRRQAPLRGLVLMRSYLLWPIPLISYSFLIKCQTIHDNNPCRHDTAR